MNYFHPLLLDTVVAAAMRRSLANMNWRHIRRAAWKRRRSAGTACKRKRR